VADLRHGKSKASLINKKLILRNKQLNPVGIMLSVNQSDRKLYVDNAIHMPDFYISSVINGLCLDALSLLCLPAKNVA
jgi:hypothetical protein